MDFFVVRNRRIRQALGLVGIIVCLPQKSGGLILAYHRRETRCMRYWASGWCMLSFLVIQIYRWSLYSVSIRSTFSRTADGRLRHCGFLSLISRTVEAWRSGTTLRSRGESSSKDSIHSADLGREILQMSVWWQLENQGLRFDTTLERACVRPPQGRAAPFCWHPGLEDWGLYLPWVVAKTKFELIDIE